MDHESRLKRNRIRAWRRGTREMDLILGPFADAAMQAMDEEELGIFEALLDVSDITLLTWMTGAAEPDDEHRRLRPMVNTIRNHDFNRV